MVSFAAPVISLCMSVIILPVWSAEQRPSIRLRLTDPPAAPCINRLVAFGQTLREGLLRKAT